jgi:hypothetical protein
VRAEPANPHPSRRLLAKLTKTTKTTKSRAQVFVDFVLFVNIVKQQWPLRCPDTADGTFAC